MLLMVRRLEGTGGFVITDVKGFGETRSFLIDGRRGWLTREDNPAPFDSLDFGRAGGGGK
jgi:hypothetical protein